MENQRIKGRRQVTKRILAFGMIVALLSGVGLLIAPSISHAGTVTSVCVSNVLGNANFGTVGGGCPNTTLGVAPSNIWILGPGNQVTLPANGTLVLTQNAVLSVDFNFDTSDFGASPYRVLVNGVQVGGAANFDNVRLNFGGVDNPDSTSINEAGNWRFLGSVPGGGPNETLDVYTGYADTLHTNLCADADPGGGHCRPNIPGSSDPALNVYDGLGGSTFPDRFIGNRSTAPPGYPVSTNPFHCQSATETLCYDDGAILIVERVRVVPEPSSLFLLGAGLMGVAAYGRKYLRKNG
jgi:hypothetical protein